MAKKRKKKDIYTCRNEFFSLFLNLTSGSWDRDEIERRDEVCWRRFCQPFFHSIHLLADDISDPVLMNREEKERRLPAPTPPSSSSSSSHTEIESWTDAAAVMPSSS